MLQRAFSYHAPTFPGSQWIPAVSGTAVFGYGGWPFLLGAWRELRDRLPGMMTLIALAITVAFVFSAAVTLGYPGMPLWEELATLVTIMLLGHWLERLQHRCHSARGRRARALGSRPLAHCWCGAHVGEYDHRRGERAAASPRVTRHTG
jgi:Cu2+-exporting ATPase